MRHKILLCRNRHIFSVDLTGEEDLFEIMQHYLLILMGRIL